MKKQEPDVLHDDPYPSDFKQDPKREFQHPPDLTPKQEPVYRLEQPVECGIVGTEMEGKQEPDKTISKTYSEEVFKQMVIDAFDTGFKDSGLTYLSGEQYYNETFK